MKFVVLKLPWPKGAPTMPEFVARAEHDFEAERARCVALLKRFAAKPMDDPWPRNPVFGEVSGQYVSRLHAKHLDHHLRQFGV
jgi:hypothetical protein